MCTAEDRWKDHQSVELAYIMEYQYRDFSVLTQAILIRSRHHTSAVELAVHDRGKPYFLVAVALTIDNDSRVFRLKVKQQPGDRDLCVVDRLRIEAHGRIRKGFLIDIPCKIVAGSCRIIVELVLNLDSVNIIDKTI